MNNYRPDIDGLRAIAVLSVVAYHIYPGLLPGGFVGVDIFFVISGFLITDLIYRKSLSNNFSFKDFYIRRIRRLAPALIAMSLAVIIYSYFLLLPKDIYSLAKSLIAQPLALQNLNFLIEGEYFQGADKKPLLHTWSLGVEEQFYIFWPLLITFACKFRRIWLLSSLLIIIFASFALNLIIENYSPKASFFLLPTRAWELAMGGFLAVLQYSKPESSRLKSLYLSRIIGFFGVLLLIFSLVFISDDQRFPGWIAWGPVLASVLIVAVSSQPIVSLKLVLESRLLVFIGLISYSLYLWHWPIIVFAKFHNLDTHEPQIASALFITAIVLAILSYKYVEQPIRTGRFAKTTNSLLLIAVSSGIFLIAIGIFSIQTKGLDFRFEEKDRMLLTASFDQRSTNRCGFVFRAINPSAQICKINTASNSHGEATKKILIWGNSHADMWSKLLLDLGEEHNIPVYLNTRNCRATADHSFCNQAVQSDIIDSISEEQITDVLLASTWYGAYGIKDQIFEHELTRLVTLLSEKGLQVWLLVDVPNSKNLDPEYWYGQISNDPFGSITLEAHENNQRNKELKLFNKLSKSLNNVHVIDPTSIYCSNTDRCFGGDHTGAWYIDQNHLTLTGAKRASGFFKPIFEK